MKLIVKVSTTFLLLMAVYVIAVGQETKPSFAPGLAEVIASEKQEGSVYTNAFLGLRFEVPDGWRFVVDETKKRMMEQGKKFMKPTDSVQQADLDKSMTNTAMLMTLVQSPAAPPIQAGLILGVEKLPSDGITATTYVAQLKKLLTENSTLNYSVEKDVHPETINGQPFVAMDVLLTRPDARVSQRYVCQMRKGYALCFIETYGSAEQLAALNQVVAGLSFR